MGPAHPVVAFAHARHVAPPASSTDGPVAGTGAPRRGTFRDPLGLQRRLLRGGRRAVRDADRERFVARSRIIADSPALSASKPAAQVDFEQALVDALTRRDAAAGVPPRVFDLRLAVGVVSAAYRAAIDTWLAGNDDRDLEAIVDEAFDRLTADLTG